MIFSHHAYVVLGPREEVWAQLGKELGVAGFSVFLIDRERLAIEDSRGIRNQCQSTNLQGGQIAIVLKVGSATIEAQNALLKTLEEPSQNCVFFLLAENEDFFLPTVCSRCQILNWRNELVGKAVNHEELKIVENFHLADLTAKYKIIEKYVEPGTPGDKERFKEFLVLLEKNAKKGGRLLEKIWQIRRSLNSQLASIKLLIDELVMTC